MVSIYKIIEFLLLLLSLFAVFFNTTWWQFAEIWIQLYIAPSSEYALHVYSWY